MGKNDQLPTLCVFLMTDLQVSYVYNFGRTFKGVYQILVNFYKVGWGGY